MVCVCVFDAWLDSDTHVIVIMKVRRKFVLIQNVYFFKKKASNWVLEFLGLELSDIIFNHLTVVANMLKFGTTVCIKNLLLCAQFRIFFSSNRSLIKIAIFAGNFYHFYPFYLLFSNRNKIVDFCIMHIQCLITTDFFFSPWFISHHHFLKWKLTGAATRLNVRIHHPLSPLAIQIPYPTDITTNLQ